MMATGSAAAATGGTDVPATEGGGGMPMLRLLAHRGGTTCWGGGYRQAILTWQVT